MRCSTCKEDKDSSCFYFKNRELGTYQTVCKICHKVYLANSYRKHRDRRLEKSYRWRLDNLEHFRVLNTMHKNLKRGQKFCTCCSWDDFFNYFNNRPKGCHIDHIVPIRLGGLNCLKNLQYLPAGQHSAKSNTERGRLEL